MGSNPTSINQNYCLLFFLIKNFFKNFYRAIRFICDVPSTPGNRKERGSSIKGGTPRVDLYRPHGRYVPSLATTPGLYIGGSPSGTCTTRVQAQGRRGAPMSSHFADSKGQRNVTWKFRHQFRIRKFSSSCCNTRGLILLKISYLFHISRGVRTHDPIARSLMLWPLGHR